MVKHFICFPPPFSYHRSWLCLSHNDTSGTESMANRLVKTKIYKIPLLFRALKCKRGSTVNFSLKQPMIWPCMYRYACILRTYIYLHTITNYIYWKYIHTNIRVCTYAYLHLYTYKNTYTYTYIHTYINIYIQKYTYIICIYIHMCVCVSARENTNRHMYIQTYTPTYIHT